MANDSERRLCVFGQMETAALIGSDRATDVDAVDLDFTQVITSPAERICDVGACALTSQQLKDYADSAAPQEITSVVAPSCDIFGPATS